MLAASVRAVLVGRGIGAALDSPEDRALFGALPAEDLSAIGQDFRNTMTSWSVGARLRISRTRSARPHRLLRYSLS